MADCVYSVEPLTFTGDDQYWDRLENQAFVDYVWYQHGFNKDYWQGGWGYDYCNDVTQPLGRALAAFWMLNYGAKDYQNDGYDESMLNWAPRYVREQLKWCDDTRASCGDGSRLATASGCQTHRSYLEETCAEYYRENKCSEWHWLVSWLCLSFTLVVTGLCLVWGWTRVGFCTLYYGTVGGGQSLTLHLPFFYTGPTPTDYPSDVFLRASTLVHEARHIGNHPHDADFPPGSDYAGQGEGADSSWDYQGAWTFTAGYCWWFREEGARTTELMRERAKNYGNHVLANCFAANPGFLIS